MEKLELKHIVGYLPYKLQCQYLGITNGSIISQNRRNYEKENQPYINWEHHEEIPYEYGLKIGYLKEIKIFKDYWKCFIGIKHTGLKSFYNGSNFKPILRPLSDLTKEIEVNGEKFVPIVKLSKIIANIHNDDQDDKFIIKDDGRILVKTPWDLRVEMFYKTNSICWAVYDTWNGQEKRTNNQYFALEKLYEWHFDIHGLIEKGEAISINDI